MKQSTMLESSHFRSTSDKYTT